jgi:predicted NAD/FAD-binding protein
MEVQQKQDRVRINLAQGAKGITRFDITAEAESAEQAAAMLGDAIDRARGVMAAKGLKEDHE